MTFAGLTGIGSKPFYVTAGVLASLGRVSFLSIVISGTIGHSLGNYLQYEIVKRKGVEWFSKIPGFSTAKISKFTRTFNKKPLFYLILGKLVEPVKSFIAVCAGLARTPMTFFLPIIFIGSLIWAVVFTGIGFYFGQNFTNASYVGFVLLALGVILIFYFQKQFGK